MPRPASGEGGVDLRRYGRVVRTRLLLAGFFVLIGAAICAAVHAT